MDALAARLHDTRLDTLALVSGLSDEALHRPLDPVMSPLVWDLAHIAAYEDLWAVHRYGSEPLLREDIAALYDAFETPRTARADAPLLYYRGALGYMEQVRDRTLRVLEAKGPSELHELVLRHELQHTETMRQALFLGGLRGGTPERLPSLPRAPDWVELEGEAEIGAPSDGFAYDNERPRHSVTLAPFAIQRTPVTNASFMSFAEGGGYEYRPWWSEEAWAWKQCYDITRPLGWEDGPPPLGEPVQHVSWFEADAFARSQGARLPTEAEWEMAATSNRETALEGVGLVWEWTSSEFTGYPGFVAHPYREYSEVFFDQGYRVLRGGSWATAPVVASPTFRNWDRPERRQIFSGIRLARDI